MRVRVTGVLFVGPLLLSATVATAQPAGTFTIELPIQRTTASGAPADTQRDFGAALEFDHLFASERGRAFYEMTMEAFGAADGLRTWLHNAGVMGTFGTDQRAVDLGGSVFWRANEGSWADAGFRGVNLLASGRLKPSAAVTLAASYGMYLRSFPDEPALNQAEHYASTRALINLQTRTTLVTVLSIGRKAYDGREALVVYSEPPASGVDPTQPALHGGRGWRQSLLSAPIIETTGAPGARAQWSWAARVAQSLDERTGVWLEREERRTRGDLPPAIVWTPPLFYDDGVYDDPYVIDARTWRAGARHVFAAGPELSAWGSAAERAYAGLDRHDTLRRAGLEAMVPIRSGTRGQLSVVSGYTFFDNQSSEPLESYRAHQVSAGLRVSF
jgi:hypothetical protein